MSSPLLRTARFERTNEKGCAMVEDAMRQPVALVTGASSGIGRATALKLAQSGFLVFGVALDEPPSPTLAAEAAMMRSMPLDVTDRQAVNALAVTIGEQQGGIDVLVCAAGVNVKRRRFEEVTEEDWRRVLDVNATGVFNVAQACLPLLRARAGLMILVSSASGRWPDASGPAYQASKRAVLGLAHALALEEPEHGVRVTVLLPGLVDTPLLNMRPQPPSAAVRAKALQPEDIGDICVFLSRLPPRMVIPELVVLPSALQRIGKT
jgi:NAD(P)-dependent dehydrogenase (short-subunit alcohol dehydrogenase family)